jgi:hypothetical protein
VDKGPLPGFQWKSCDMSYALSVMDVIIAADGSVLESGLNFGQPARLQCEFSNALHFCAPMSVVKYFRIFRSRMTSVRARGVQEQACFSDIDLASFSQSGGVIILAECLTHDNYNLLPLCTPALP